MVKTHDLLRALMDRSGDNPNSLAEKVNQRSKQPQIFRFLQGIAKEPRRSTLEPLAEFYKVPVEAFYDEALAARLLRQLSADISRSQRAGVDVDSRKTIEPSPVEIQRGLPLISWIQAGEWSDLSDPYRPGEAEDWLPSPARTGPRAYCLRVRGDSMYNPGGRPSYSNGDIIFVDPDRDAKPGDRVIVRLDDQHEATFKQLLIEDGRKMLKALNPEWTPRYIEINGNATITGVIVGKWVPE